MAGILQAKKAIYHLDMEGFWLGDKCRLITELPLCLVEYHKNPALPGVNDLVQKQQLSRRERSPSGNQQVGLVIAGLAHDPAPVIDAVSIFQDYPGGGG
jgi:hypothetical protein